jgi:hypothetical protein
MEPHPERIRAIAEQLRYHAYLYRLPQYLDERKARNCEHRAKLLDAKADRQEAKLKSGR